MSAKKRASAPAKKSASPSNRKSSVAAAMDARAKSQRTLSNHDIGEVAGEIWNLLAQSDGQTLAALKKSVGAPADVVAAAVGWLAREDKLLFDVGGRTMKISLKH